MGRWAQQRRRGGSPPPTPPPPSGPNMTFAADVGGGLINLFFDGDIVVDPLGVPDLGAFTLDGNPVTVTAAVLLGTTVCQVQQTIDPSTGMTAAWASQPPYITTPISLAFPQVVA